jgi:hypothetical protein
MRSSPSARNWLPGQFRLSTLPFRLDTRHRVRSHDQSQLQLQRRARMQLIPQSQQCVGHPGAEAPRVVQPYMAADAQCNQQWRRIPLVPMVDHQSPGRPARSASEAVTFKNQITQAAEPAQRIVLAIITQPATTQTLQFNWSTAARAEHSQLSPPPFRRRHRE